MKTIKFIPKAVQEGKFEGFIELRVPTFEERYEALDAAGIEIKDGEGEVANPMKKIVGMVRESKKFYQKVELKRLENGEPVSAYNSLDELELDPECDAILIEVASAMTKGFVPGKI